MKLCARMTQRPSIWWSKATRCRNHTFCVQRSTHTFSKAILELRLASGPSPHNASRHTQNHCFSIVNPRHPSSYLQRRHDDREVTEVTPSRRTRGDEAAVAQVTMCGWQVGGNVAAVGRGPWDYRIFPGGREAGRLKRHFRYRAEHIEWQA